MKKPQPQDEHWRMRIARLELREGDTLVASVDGTPSAGYVHTLRENLEMIAPTGVAVLIVSSDVKFSVVGGA